MDIFGTHLKDQVEERLKFYETGETPKKNVDVMKDAMEEVSCLDQFCFWLIWFINQRALCSHALFIIMVPTGTGNHGKPGKMGGHFPVREKSGNFVKTGKVIKS